MTRITNRTFDDDYAGFAVEIEEGVLTIRLNRPEAGNTLQSAAIPQLAAIFREIPSRDDVRVLLIRAEGASFSVGGDVKAFASTITQTPDERYADYFARMDRAREQMEAFIGLECPIIVACQGPVAGAAVSYPLGADIALAEPGTRFFFSHQRLGLTPDGGLSVLLPRVVGVRKATELVLTSATVDAEEALRLGIVSRIVATDVLQEEAIKLARRIASGPRDAVRRARALLHESVGRPIRAQLEAERDAIAVAVSEPDFEEGVRAFIEKRRPNFSSAR